VGAEFGLLEEVAGGVEREMAVSEFDAPAGVAGDVHVVGDHKDRVSGLVEFAKNIDYDFFVDFVEIARGFVGKDEFWLINERAGDGDALLFAAGEFCGEMFEAVGEADTFEGFDGLRFVGDGMEILREHDVFEGREIRDEMKLLEDETDFFRAVADEIRFVEARNVLAIHGDATGRGGVETAKDIDESGFAGAGRTHEGDPFAWLDAETYAAQRAKRAVFLDEIFQDDLRRRL